MMDTVDYKGFYYQLTQEGQMRWLGPEKGVFGMAVGAILNAVWDLLARRAGKPLWLFVGEMEPEELIKYIDFKHIEDFVSREEAIQLLRKVRPGWQKRVANMARELFLTKQRQRGCGNPVPVKMNSKRDSFVFYHICFQL